MRQFKVSGLVAATYTPMHSDGSVWAEQIGPMVEHLSGSSVDGLYVCGSTGEGISLNGSERRLVAEGYVSAAEKYNLPVIVQVGHNSLFEARDLSRHAQEIGATAFSANAPSYFKVQDIPTLVDCMASIASAAPELPFYYYHIPHLTGAQVSMLEFLEMAADRIPNLAGIKYTAPTVHEYQACREWRDESMDVLWGSDEMLLSALAVGAEGAVGSTYNVAAPLYKRVMEAFAEGDLPRAREWMSRSINMIRTIYHYPFHSAMKAVLEMQGVACGQCRLPQQSVSAADVERLKQELDEIGFFDWSRG